MSVVLPRAEAYVGALACLFLSLLSGTALCEAVFFPDEPQGIYARAVEYDPDQDPLGIVAQMLGLTGLANKAVLSVSPGSGEYTYWFTDELERRRKSFFLPTFVRGGLRVGVSRAGNLYAYRYRFMPDDERAEELLRNIVMIMGTADYKLENSASSGFGYVTLTALDGTPRLLVSRRRLGAGNNKPAVQFEIVSPALPAIVRANAMTFEEPPPIPGGSIGLEGASAVTRTIGPGIVTYGSLQEMFLRVRPIASRYGWATDHQLAALAVLVEDRKLDEAERLHAFRERCESMRLSELAALTMSVVTR